MFQRQKMNFWKRMLPFKLALIFLLFASGIRAASNASGNTVKIVFKGQTEQTVQSPLRLAADDNGRIYVAAAPCYIYKFDSSGAWLGRITLKGRPLALAVFNRTIYVSLAGQSVITQVDTSGQIIRTFGSVALASDMAIDKVQKLYVVDSKKRQVQVYDLQGRALYSFSSPMFVRPAGIAIDEKNQRILITEHGGIVPPDSSLPLAAVHVFDLQGHWQESYGHYGAENAQFARMQGMDTDNLGRMFITDSYQGLIKVLDQYGTFLTVLGQFGFDKNQLAQPMDALIDRFNHLWVSSYNTNALLRFEIEGLPVSLDQDAKDLLPVQTRLLQNYPNPFNGGTVIPFTLNAGGTVHIRIYNASGQRIRSVNLGRLGQGKYLAKGRAYYWDGKNEAGQQVASGVYYYELQTDRYRAVRRMLLIK